MSHLSIFRNFWEPFLNLMMSKKKNPLFVRGWDRKIHPSGSSFVITMPNGDRQDRFFYPTLTLMMDTCNPDHHQEYSILEIQQSELTKMFLKLPCGCNPGLIYFTFTSISRPIKALLPVYMGLIGRKSDIVACEQQRLRSRLRPACAEFCGLISPYVILTQYW